MTDLLQAQMEFAHMLGHLLCYAATHDVKLTIGEAWRPPETAELYAKQGRGSAKSLHCKRLAVDLAVFDGAGQYRTEVDAYRLLGEYWESLGGAWGGRFTSLIDPYHFSLSFEGMK